MKMPPINSSDYIAKNLWPWYRASYSNNRTLLISCKWDVPLRDYSHHRWVLALASNCCQVPPNKHHPFLWCLRNKKKQHQQTSLIPGKSGDLPEQKMQRKTNVTTQWWVPKRHSRFCRTSFSFMSGKRPASAIQKKKTLPIFLVTFSW